MHISARAAMTPPTASERRPMVSAVTTDDQTMEAIGRQFEVAMGASRPGVRPPSPAFLFRDTSAEPAPRTSTSPGPTAEGRTSGDGLFDLIGRIISRG